MIAFAAIMSSIAVLTGILAVGSGRHWQFATKDYFLGKQSAILYLWVTASTIFSICHAGMLVDLGLRNNWVPPYPETPKWMALHACIGVLLVGAHIFVAGTLSRDFGSTEKFLWGKNRHNAGS